MQKLTHFFYDLFIKAGLPKDMSAFLNAVLTLFFVLLVAFFISKLLRIILVEIMRRVFARYRTQFDDFFIENRVFFNLTNLLVLFIVKAFIPFIFIDFNHQVSGINTFIDICILLVIIWTVRSFFKTLNSYLKTLDSFKNKPVDSYVQVIMIFIWFLGFLALFSLITGSTPWEFLTAMGAVSAVILLIFKDSILGFVASIQISVNDTVRIGDWIAMSKFEADGIVIEINLNTVLVQNWDKTITSIPTYYLNTEAFTNWRGMEESGGRQIKRSIHIKATTVRFLTANETNELAKINLLKEYIENWQKEVGQKRKEHDGSRSYCINERNLTNLGLFRNYINFYLQQRDDIHQENFLMLCRQMEATPHGIPLQIYAFSKHTSFMFINPQIGEIFDHFFAILPLFDLEVFEYPTGNDFNQRHIDKYETTLKDLNKS